MLLTKLGWGGPEWLYAHGVVTREMNNKKSYF